MLARSTLRLTALALAALALLVTAAGAPAGPPAPSPHKQKGPILLSVRSKCHGETVLAFARTYDPATAKALLLRLDGVEIGAMSRERPGALAVSVDCASLRPGVHVLSASLRSADGTRAKMQRTFRRMPDPQLGASF
jgi:hypothetical protein